MTRCACGLERPYEACCGRLHAGALASTPEELMRSRYTAFAKGLWPYLAETQVAPLEPGPTLAWVGLTVHEAKGDEVEFTARYVEGGREVSLTERSRFEQHDGRWRYVTGRSRVTAKKLGRNEPCPCASGKKLKACHGAD
ncbi:MAG: SEC-C domain-containing protein [Myxococcaceae bacterium]|nr:SEC-C domain-containing protein [Myxococcaceae bacterium]